ncbi:unnamed protein product [Symbiodinium sp. CCMP2592]|nr:unnamed protein product [Symbiodinium sp. CCMP2592]
MSKSGLEVCLGMPEPCEGELSPSGEEETSSSDVSHESWAWNPLLESHIALLTEMQATSSQIVRGIRTYYRILQGGPRHWMNGRLLGCPLGSFYFTAASLTKRRM